MPQISVIVPIFNVEKYIRQCMESLVHQTMQDIEIICVDDCGTDKSIDIVREFAKHDNRIKIVHNPHNMDIADTRTNGIIHSNAPYIMWCDPDDWYCNDMCEKMYNAITYNNSDVAICGTNVIYETDRNKQAADRVYFDIEQDKTCTLTDDIRAKTNVVVWNKIFRRDIINQFDITFPSKLRYEDEYFWHTYTTHARTITFVTDKLYNYRRNSGSIMNKTFTKRADYGIDSLRIAIEYFKYLNKHGLYNSLYEYYWTHSFAACATAAIQRANSRASLRAIINLASDFANKNYVRPVSDFFTDHQIKLFQTKQISLGHNTSLYPVWYNKRTAYRSEWFLCKICLFKIKINPEFRQYYIFGIPIKRIKNEQI